MLKPIFHQKLCLCWVLNTNKKEDYQDEIDMPNINRIPPARIRAHIGLVGICVESEEVALSLWKFSLGLQGFLDTHLLVLAMENACLQGLNQSNAPRRMGLCSGGI